jgi:hypothetical protein
MYSKFFSGGQNTYFIYRKIEAAGFSLQAFNIKNPKELT